MLKKFIMPIMLVLMIVLLPDVGHAQGRVMQTESTGGGDVTGTTSYSWNSGSQTIETYCHKLSDWDDSGFGYDPVYQQVIDARDQYSCPSGYTTVTADSGPGHGAFDEDQAWIWCYHQGPGN